MNASVHPNEIVMSGAASATADVVTEVTSGPTCSAGDECERWAELERERNVLRWKAGYWRSLHQRALERQKNLEEELAQVHAKLKLRERQLFEKTSERDASRSSKKDGGSTTKQGNKRKRGNTKETKGHGRRPHTNLPVEEEFHDVGERDLVCPSCSRPRVPMESTEDSEVVEVEVRAYRRKIRRRRVRSTCDCPDLPQTVTAPVPPKLIPKGAFGVSFWVLVLLNKFLYQRPTWRLLTELRESHGLNVSQGTVTGGLCRLKPLFEPLYNELIAKSLDGSHWYADETRWLVFGEEIEGKTGSKWYLWVFRSKTTVIFKLDPSRSADVPKGFFGREVCGILSVDRYSAYKTLLDCRMLLLAFCWAHVRRDFLAVAKDWEHLESWGLEWVKRIGGIYKLNKERLKVLDDPCAFKPAQAKLVSALDQMATDRDAQLADSDLHSACRKVLESLERHWSGLLVFVEYPDVPMDNNTAERELRNPAMGRKNYYGSGSRWSGDLAAMLFSLFQTLRLWNINPRLWLSDYLHACAEQRGQPPPDLARFLPWNLDEEQKQRYSNTSSGQTSNDNTS